MSFHMFYYCVVTYNSYFFLFLCRWQIIGKNWRWFKKWARIIRRRRSQVNWFYIQKKSIKKGQKISVLMKMSRIFLKRHWIFTFFFLVMKMRKLAKSDLSRNQSVDFTGKERFHINIFYVRILICIHSVPVRHKCAKNSTANSAQVWWK